MIKIVCWKWLLVQIKVCTEIEDLGKINKCSIKILQILQPCPYDCCDLDYRAVAKPLLKAHTIGRLHSCAYSSVGISGRRVIPIYANSFVRIDKYCSSFQGGINWFEQIEKRAFRSFRNDTVPGFGWQDSVCLVQQNVFDARLKRVPWVYQLLLDLYRNQLLK